MTTKTKYTKDEISEILSDQFDDLDDVSLLADAIRKINRWLARGDGVAVYENVDLGHPFLGHKQFLSFGSDAAILEVEREEDLPDRLPDTPTTINWRYYLQGTYRGEAL